MTRSEYTLLVRENEVNQAFDKLKQGFCARDRKTLVKAAATIVSF